MVESTELMDGWLLRGLRGPFPDGLRERLDAGVPVEVPGTVHAMCVDAGLIADPFLGDNETAARWVGFCRWELSRTVTIPERRHWDLEFDGIDTVAQVLWDGVPVASVRNMHRRLRIDLGDIDPGEHRLTIVFESPELEAVAAQGRTGGPRPNPYGRPFEALRKAACNFGWDWGPDLPSAGLWRGVRLVGWQDARLLDVGVRTNEGLDGDWLVTTTVTLRADRPVCARVQIAGTEASVSAPAGEQTLTLTQTCASPDLWWPRSHGRATLYDHVVTLASDDRVLDRRSLRTGFRTISLDQTPDAHGTAFTLLVNQTPVFARGVNWIPDHAFPGRTSVLDLRERLTDATDAGCNLVRVWGGGYYESDDFYDLTDELGLLVWQDFAFACSGYSEDAEIASEVEAEARDAIARLHRRASLALWCGNNENLWAYETWDGWQENLAGRTWGEGYYLGLLPRLCAELDPDRAYWPGTPWSGDGLPANDDDHGCQHLWDVWNDLDHERYVDHHPRFVAEFGYQGPPAWTTLAEAIGEEHMVVNDPVLLSHQKAEDGAHKVERGLASHGGSSDEILVWWWRSQHLQARAARVGIGHLRSCERCMGSVWWQLNDCWPVISWSVVDSAGRRKPVWYAMRAAHADRLLSIVGDEVAVLSAVNDTDEPWTATVTVEACSPITGAVTAVCADLDLAPRSRGALDVDLTALPPDSVLRARTPQVCSDAWWPRRLDGTRLAGRHTLEAVRTADGWDLTLTADDPLIDVTWWVDRVHPGASIEDGLLTLWPGESRTVHVQGGVDASASRFGDPDVLWHWGR